MRRLPRRPTLTVLALFLVWLTSALWQAYKPLPPGIGEVRPWRTAPEVTFLADLTFVDSLGVRRSEQAIFDAAHAMIGQARRLVVLDMFLFNDFAGAEESILRPLSGELNEALLQRLRQVPELRVVVITDPINTVYGGMRSPHLQRLRDAGAEVIETDLAALRASNPIWSGPWALCCAWLGNTAEGGWLPNPFGQQHIPLRSWLALPNFRANHRKTLVVDRDSGWQALVTSANPHDASSAHGNIALRFSGAAALDLLASEAAVAAFSGTPLHDLPQPDVDESVEGPRLRVLTESAIADALIDVTEHAAPGEALDVAVFYLAHRGLIRSLLNAHARGVTVRVLLDPNEDAFGRKKNGVPNRQVAHELVAAGIPVRWCDTHGEQCHAKLLLHRGAGEATLIAGSANFTRRNLNDLNLETSMQLVADVSHPAMRDATHWFESGWTNLPDKRFSTDYAQYQDDALLRRAWYRIGEAAGLSTW
ncbi:phospholipase D family protein [Xanthomonadaceae bacterium JHOS43]|nr:phospholipase D family protein [Xanthomonadaceae bacterium JHOS43]